MSSQSLADLPAWRRVETALIGTARQLRSVFDHRLAEVDLNLSQATLLAYVDQHGSSSQSELAQMVDLGRAATGTMIDQLEERDLLVREPDPCDRRVWLIALTPAGVELVRRVEAIDATLRAELRTGITRAERQQLADLLSRLSVNIGNALDCPSPASAGAGSGPPTTTDSTD